MRLWDCFMLRDELDLLECRLVQLDASPVYRHVLVEAAADHRGNPKSLAFADNRERFAPWLDKIVHVVADALPAMTGAAPMDREAAQRDATGTGLADAEPGDRLILADLDEIPGDRGVQAATGDGTGVLEMTCCLFAVDWVWGPLKTSVLCSVRDVTSFSAARRHGWSAWPVIPAAGHHLSWLGGQAGIAVKTAAHCHAECDGELLAGNADDALYRTGVNPFGRIASGTPGPAVLTPVDIDASWPRYVWERRCPENWFRPRP